VTTPIDEFVISVDCSGPGGFPKVSKTRYNVLRTTAANFTAQVGLMHTLEQKYEPLTLGVVKITGLTYNVEVNSGYPASAANRGSKMIISSTDPNGKVFTHTIPAFDESGTHLNADHNTLNTGDTDVAAYKTAFEAVALSPAGLALTLQRGVMGGRRA